MISQDDIDGMQELEIKPDYCLAEFIKAFGASLDPRLWINLIKEELEELYSEKVNTVEHLKEYVDLYYVTIGLSMVLKKGFTTGLLPEEELKELKALLKKSDNALLGFHHVYGEPKIAEAFNRVHLSNMSKLGEDGKPIRREDGKILKGPNYKAPDLTDLI